MEKYTVKTRNWNGRKIIATFLSLSCYFGTTRYEGGDSDNKYLLKTGSKLMAWSIWVYFMMLRKWSGGWTYIVRPGNSVGEGYKAIY